VRHNPKDTRYCGGFVYGCLYVGFGPFRPENGGVAHAERRGGSKRIFQNRLHDKPRHRKTAARNKRGDDARKSYATDDKPRRFAAFVEYCKENFFERKRAAADENAHDEKQKNKREKYKDYRDFFCSYDVVLFAYGKRFFVLSVHIDKIMQKKQAFVKQYLWFCSDNLIITILYRTQCLICRNLPNKQY